VSYPDVAITRDKTRPTTQPTTQPAASDKPDKPDKSANRPAE
jgi:hypothetical protein